jgi:hypothetical protein
MFLLPGVQFEAFRQICVNFFIIKDFSEKKKMVKARLMRGARLNNFITYLSPCFPIDLARYS